MFVNLFYYMAFPLLMMIPLCANFNSIETLPNHLVINMLNESTLPKNFRTVRDSFTIEPDVKTTREGLDTLRISGSGQFSEQSLNKVVEKISTPLPIYIVDLRQESHGFLNGIAVSWYAIKDWGNLGKNSEDVQKLEQHLLANLAQKKQIRIFRILSKDTTGEKLPEVTPVAFTVQRAQMEKDIVRARGLQYVRIAVTDHVRPTDQAVDQFLDFIHHLPKERWIHFHCAAGVGRTTTFMAMYDMMQNAKHVSFEDIIRRQWLIGGLNLVKMSKKSWKLPYVIERIEFLKEFYDYCRSESKDNEMSWTEYLNQKSMTASF